jgi:hypothetical protein
MSNKANNSSDKMEEKSGSIQISNYAKLLVFKKTVGFVYFGNPISRRSCGNKSRYDICGMGKNKSRFMKRKSRMIKFNPSRDLDRRIATSDPVYASYLQKHGLQDARSKGEGASVIYPTLGSPKKRI